uniref:Cobyrinic acid a,c-diamide synthase n=1 Tax=Nitratidesulfovibrio vulgaris (strain DSM 19637 / Miyazaki F) TaxID=883 RepID=B8DRW5_NITV9
MNLPRIVIAGLSGGSGKTLVSLGVVRALARSGLAIKPCKKGPDYIDAWWLALAAGHPATNLDPYFLDADRLRSLFWTRCGLAGEGSTRDAALARVRHGQTDPTGPAAAPPCPARPTRPAPPADQPGPFDMAVIEGNRGLFDGRDLSGSCSTAELARILGAPVVVVMDCTKMTRTAAAIVSGLRHFEQGVHIAGVILNRTAGPRHRSVLRETIEHYTDVPVLGVLPKIAANPIPERHMGLVSGMEHEECVAGLDKVADIMAEHVDLHRLRQVACAAPPPQGPVANLWSLLPGAETTIPDDAVQRVAGQCDVVPGDVVPGDAALSDTVPGDTAPPRIGYVHDAALWFYYEENLLALRHAGAELVRLSLLDGACWPQLDGLYLGGGFPETLAARLSANRPALDRLRGLSESGLPIYAECGGFMVLGRSIVMGGTEHPMADIFPVRTVFHAKPQGLGYVDATAVLENPFHPVGTTFRGHEFHYSRCVPCDDAAGTPGTLAVPNALRLTAQSGHVTGMGDGRDGLLLRNTMAAYTHIFAPAVPHWAPAMVRAARAFRSGRPSSSNLI